VSVKGWIDEAMEMLQRKCPEMNMMLGAILAVYGEFKPGFINDLILPC
jgi:hypothetical protein